MVAFERLKKERMHVEMGPKYPEFFPGRPNPKISVDTYQYEQQIGSGDHGFIATFQVNRAEEEFCDDIQPIQMICRTDPGVKVPPIGGIPDALPRTQSGCVIDHNSNIYDVDRPKCKEGMGCSPYYGDHFKDMISYDKKTQTYKLKDEPAAAPNRTDRFEICWACIKNGRFVGWLGCICGIEKTSTGKNAANWKKSKPTSCGPSKEFNEAMSNFNYYYNHSRANVPITGPDNPTPEE
jgi:hypothetical protein